MAKEKKQFKVELDPGLAAKADEYFDRVGTNRTVGIERMLAWFLELPPTIQAEAMGQLPQEIRQDAVYALLVRMKDTPGVASAAAADDAAQARTQTPRKTRRSGA